jgi:tetratricopeptide (TPR) repeat protein
MMVASESERAIQLGEEALALAEELGLDDIRASALNSVGSARAALGEADLAREQLTQAIEVAREANVPWEVSRAMNNLAAFTVWIPGGSVREATELAREAQAAAERYGQGVMVRFQNGILVARTYDVGLWDEASARADAFLAEVEAGASHYMAAQCYSVRAALRLGRGNPAAALADVDRCLDDAERANDPQVVLTTGALVAHVLLEAGLEQRAAGLAEELLAEMEAGRWVDFGTSASHVAAWTLTALGHGERVAAALESQRALPFVRAGIAFASGDPVGAAQICAATGATTEEAYARLCAAERLAAQARRAEAEEQLEQALAFYRSVGATHYVRRGESLRQPRCESG